MLRKKLLLIALLIVGCEGILDTDATSPIVVITYPANNSTLDSTITVKTDITDNSAISMSHITIN
jgi:hypothetical protein